MRDIWRQIRTDFAMLPGLVDQYVVHTPRKEALKAARQVCGVTHYLSLMATGEVDMETCALFGVAITCIDEVTDELGEELYPTPIAQAFMDEPPYESLAVLPELADRAKDDRFEHAVREIAKGQDQSLMQTGDLDNWQAEQIAKQKGGWSGRANLALVKSNISDDEWDMMENWGFVMQMLDDYLDQPKDRRAGISTVYTEGVWGDDDLAVLLGTLEDRTAKTWGTSSAHRRFFQICRLHRRLGQVENKTPLRASWFAPGYL